jgi:hypothetical protein
VGGVPLSKALRAVPQSSINAPAFWIAMALYRFPLGSLPLAFAWIRPQAIGVNRTKSDHVVVNRTILKHFFYEKKHGLVGLAGVASGQSGANLRVMAKFDKNPHKHITMNELRHHHRLNLSRSVKVCQSLHEWNLCTFRVLCSSLPKHRMP